MKNRGLSTEEYIESLGIELADGASYFVNDDYCSAIIGTDNHGGLVYSYEKMIEFYVAQYDVSWDTAREWIDYNVLRTIPYMSEPRPTIVFEVEN